MYTVEPGYRQFHQDDNFNFQLNRWLPYLPEQELWAIAPQLTDFESWYQAMLSAAKQAEEEHRHTHACFYYRAAEFFLSHNNPDKAVMYEKFTSCFYANFEVSDRLDIPFENAVLPALIIEPNGPVKDTVLIHGGFDSFVEELYFQCFRLTEMGFRVVLFEGPGQGAVLRNQGVAMCAEWERPVGAVLDYLNIEACTLLGISLGGYLAMRAAAYEPRIQRVVAFDVLDDFLGCLTHRAGPQKGKIMGALVSMGAKAVVNKFLAKIKAKEPVVRWSMDHGVSVSGGETPYDFLKWASGLRSEGFCDRVKQDVLILAGQDDHLVPLSQFYAQTARLNNVRSLTTRLFTAAEHASSHCQIGNVELAMAVIGNWLEQQLEK
jgi:pimeloyl-ACP methyl ester carboxylesterase